jgi:hypothetical protein
VLQCFIVRFLAYQAHIRRACRMGMRRLQSTAGVWQLQVFCRQGIPVPRRDAWGNATQRAKLAAWGCGYYSVLDTDAPGSLHGDAATINGSKCGGISG